jgi:hypothetical protein
MLFSLPAGSVAAEYICKGVFAAGVLVATYYTLIALFNKSVVDISQDGLQITHGPIPYMRGTTFESATARQVFVWGGTLGRRGYDVCILTRDSLCEPIVTVWNCKLALYLEQEIERFWGIEDEVVRGEWRPEPYLWE